MGLAQQPFSFNIGYLAWIALIPTIYVIERLNSFSKTILISFIWGFVYHISVVFWLSQNIGTSSGVAFLSMIAVVLILSCNTIFIFSLWYFFKKNNNSFNSFILPFIWVSIEYLRSYGILGFPWVNIANTQLNFYYLIQNAEYVGIYGISFWVVLINVLLYDLLFRGKIKKIYVTLIFVLPFILGHYSVSQLVYDKIDNYTVSIIQPNVNLFTKRDYLNRFENLNNLIDKSKTAIQDNLDLIIWPESALSYNNLQDKKIFTHIKDNLLLNNETYILTGNVIYENSNHYNSSVLFNRDGIKQIYNKRQLVPIAEYVPFSNSFPSLKNINLGQANFSKGNKDIIFDVNGVKFSALICFESTFPGINRRHAKMGAEYFIYLVNDGWYTGPPEPQQHMKQSIFRAIENRKTIVRCANTGISSVISPSGEVREYLDLNESGKITTFIEKVNRSTFYTEYGNIFAIVTLIITLSFVIGTLYEQKKNN